MSQPVYADDLATLYVGDCREVLAGVADASVDAVVTDPPYELGFMGKRWDASGIAYDVAVWSQCLRVLKPGGHLLAFGGTRTWHRLAVAVEDAGFEVRDSIAWMYGSGFPKSLDVSKAIDKNNGEVGRKFRFTRWMCTTGVTAKQINEATNTQMGNHYLTHPTQPAIPTPELWQVIRPLCGDVPAWVDDLVARIAAEREVIGERDVPIGHAFAGETYGGDSSNATVNITAPATPAAQQWQGWGTALKPAFEPIVVARKPLIGTVAENVLEHGTGALNIHGCRIGTEVRVNPPGSTNPRVAMGGGWRTDAEPTTASGRWPANVVLDEDQADALDRQSGWSAAKPERVGRRGGNGFRFFDDDKSSSRTGRWPEDIGGGASRFFYVAKAPARERPKVDGVAHPTVKPVTLMQYLTRLVTPPGGTILEPFAGSGTTIQAAYSQGFRCIAIEKEPDYIPLIIQRIQQTKQEKDDQLPYDT